MRNPYAASSAIEDAIRFAPLDAQYYIRSGNSPPSSGDRLRFLSSVVPRLLEPARASYAWELSQYLRSIEGNSEAFFLMQRTPYVLRQ